MFIVIAAVLTMSVVIYVRVEHLISTGSETIQPFVESGLEDVSSILDNSARLSKHATHMTEQGDTLLSNSVPRLMEMLNQTQRMMLRMERFSAKPSINIGVSRD